MIQNLKYKAAFTNGRTLEQNMDLKEGVTLIHGANESGKSFSLEMVRFALFGTKALRGEVKGYKELSVQMHFRVNGHAYNVSRNLSKADLVSIIDGSPIATGTKPVNEAIIDLFGFGLDVFDVACSVNQGEVERLGFMKPTERKAMIDKIVGLDSIENLEKFARSKEKEATAAADTVGGTLVQPVEPEKPEDYQPSEALQKAIIDLAVELKEARDLGEFRNLPKPVAPDDPGITETVDDLDDAVKSYHQKKGQQERLAYLQSTPVPPSEEALAQAVVNIQQWENYSEKLAWQRRNPAPNMEFDIDQIEKMIAKHDLAHKQAMWDRKSIVCQHCGEKTAATTEDTRPGGAKDVVVPQFDLAYLKDRKSDLDHWNSAGMVAKRAEYAAVPMPTWKTDLTMSEIRDHRIYAKEREEIPVLEAALVGFVDDNPSEKLQELLQYSKLVRNYDAAMREYEADQKRKDNDVASIEEEYNNLTVFQAECLDWERRFSEFTLGTATYEKGMSVVQGHRTEAAKWNAATNAMKELRKRIKQYLLPSLNKVASNLLSNMTNGARQLVRIDDDFEIMIDGQKLQTLSGSGKAVANLAIRIGLGQVLTNGVFSVLMADEIDGSMDQERATATIDTLTNLTNNIGQILVVSHKEHDLQHKVEIT